jgi:ribonuclease HII
MAGPVVAAAVVFPAGARAIPRLNDSKVLTAEQRLALDPVIRRVALAIGVGAASVHEIDRLNIRRASILAMQRALARLALEPDHILVDGLPVPELGRPHEAIVDGDARCQSIAAASVIAKIVRDRLMERLGPRHPRYRWEENKGYCTADHLDALAAFGATPHHRRSFEPVSQLRLALDAVLSERPPAAAY